MNIRRAKEKDIERVMELLGQVLQIHADIRPDIFIPGTTKYTKDELAEMIRTIQSQFMWRWMKRMIALAMHFVN